MESAGRSAAEWILAHVHPRHALCIAGPGGNGGDALVVARCLAEAGISTRVLLACEPDCLAASTAGMLARLPEGSVETDQLSNLTASRLSSDLAWPTQIVDGLFGSGLSRPVSGRLLDLIRAVNEANAQIISLDLPSGLESDGGRVIGEAVRADVTLAMEFLKPAHLLYPAAAHSRNTAVVRVDYPVEIRRRVSPWARVPTPESAQSRLPARRPDGHKGTFGRVLVVAGSPGMTGAAILACRGALRAGAGLVYLAAPEILRPIYEAALPEVICVSWPGEDSGGRNSFEACLAKADTVAVGPGLGLGPSIEDLVRCLIDSYPGRMVVDADGLAAVGAIPKTLSSLAGRAILTPHLGEFARLTAKRVENVEATRRDLADAFAGVHGVVLLLKGRPSFVAAPGIVPVANPHREYRACYRRKRRRPDGSSGRTCGERNVPCRCGGSRCVRPRSGRGHLCAGPVGALARPHGTDRPDSEGVPGNRKNEHIEPLTSTAWNRKDGRVKAVDINGLESEGRAGESR